MYAVNIDKKKSLCEQAEFLKDSKEWRTTAERIAELRQEWKSVGITPHRQSEALWRRFSAACNYFFEQKYANYSVHRTEESANLKKKREIIAAIDALDESLAPDEALRQLRGYMEQFHQAGFVPFREKEKISAAYRTAVDKQFDRLKVDENERRLKVFRANLGDMADDRTKNKALNERDRLVRNYERMKSDVQTYENNIGFLTVSSKGGSNLLEEMQRKIESLKEELLLLEKKIEAIDQNIDA
jgi:hypothetical protein